MNKEDLQDSELDNNTTSTLSLNEFVSLLAQYKRVMHECLYQLDRTDTLYVEQSIAL